MRTLFLLLCLWLGFPGNIDGQSPCSSCTVNITSNNSSTYTLSAGQNMCISSGATFSGTISSISSTSKICITGNSNFTGTINNIPVGAQVYIESGSTYSPSGLYNVGGTITNNGTVSIGTYMTVNAAWTIANTGTINLNSGMAMNNNLSITNSGTLNFNGGFQSGTSAVTSITNSSTFLTAGYTTINAGSTINNSGVFTASAQQVYTGVTINNTAGSFYFTGSSNTVSSSSTITNAGYMSLNSFTLSGSSMSNSSNGTITFQSTFTLSNTCSFTNNGTTNLKNNYQLDNGSTMINNGNLQMNNGSAYLNTNGVFTNNGYIYVNGKVTFSNTASATNNCTIVAVGGFLNQSSSTVNNGYILIPLDATPSTSLVTLEADFTQTTNGWLQGIDFLHNGGTVKGSGNYYFSGNTNNQNTFGNGSSPAANFYDATPTSGSPSSGMFDEGWGGISNTTKTVITAVDISARATSCNASVTSQGTNTECSDGAFITSFVKNGNFSTAISNSTGNTYTSATGTTYNFSGGSFISQMDYAGTSSSICPKTNIATNGNTFAIVTLGAATSYVGTGTCSNANQYVFPGDATYSLSTQPNFMYIAGNTLAGEEYLVYQQNLTGLTIGKSYTFYFYASNMRETSANGDDPIIRLRIGGSDGVPDGTVGYGPYVLTESATQNSASLSGWRRFAYNFTATATTLKIKITDAAFTSSGDEWALTSIGVTQCRTLDNDGDGIADRVDLDDDNDGILDANEYGCSGTSTFVWGTSGTPTGQTVNGVTLTPYLRNPYGLASTTISQSNGHSGNASNDIRFIHNPSTSTQYADLVFSFSKRVVNVSFEINDIDARNNGATRWKDSVYVYFYKDGNTYTLQSTEYSLGTQVSSPATNNFVTTQTDNNLANSSNNGRVIITVTDPVDSIAIRYFDKNPNSQNAEIYISAVTFCPLVDTDGDGLYNYQDLDSDNDGIPDVIESHGVDANGDGKIDNFTDANNNGVSDNVSTCTNLLTDGSFESPVQASVGNNLTGLGTFGLWSMDATGTFNIVKTNGSYYGGGPDNAQNGTQYVDITNAADYFQQQVTLTSTAAVTFGGYFSSREQSGGYVNWTGRIDLMNASGTIVASSSSTRNFVNADGAEDQVWYYLSGSTTLAAGNYFFRAYLGDYGNFDNATFTACYTDLGTPDFDGDGVPNYIDLDSDGDGIPDVVEAGGTDANNDGIIDNFTDTDNDGFSDNVDSDMGSTALILSGSDINGDGRADSWPNKNADLIGYSNPYDLDSDGDGILDLIEAGFSGTNGVASGTLGTDGWSNTIDALGSLSLPNTDGVGAANYLDIDSDNDGITDNVEAQSTTSYKVPTDKDKDGDGINDIFETTGQIGTYGGGGLTPFDKDGDTTPDYRDTDTDNDGVPDRNEGDRNAPFVAISQATIDASGDTDGDGLMDVFDNVTITGLSILIYYKNVTMGNMGALGGFDGPTPTSSLIGLQQSDVAGDRDWRNASILPLHIINFTVNYKAPIANIKWDVANELQTHYYEVEMSLNGTDFEAVQKIGAKNVGSSSYTFPHSLANQPSGTIYYRIKQVDKDNKTFYTQIITVKITKATIPLTVSPNPFQSFINIAYTSELKEMVSLAIYSSEGKMVASKRAEVVKGTNSIQFASLQTLPSGTYILQVQGSNTGQSSKIIKH
jgi:hypothetical protein